MSQVFVTSSIDNLIGKTLYRIKKDDDKLTFYCESGEVYKMFHNQDCCENISIDDICGELDLLIGSPILKAEEIKSLETKPRNENDEFYTWTFYKFATIKGWVDVKWYGTSNGYYSESVDFFRVYNTDLANNVTGTFYSLESFKDFLKAELNKDFDKTNIDEYLYKFIENVLGIIYDY